MASTAPRKVADLPANEPVLAEASQPQAAPEPALRADPPASPQPQPERDLGDLRRLGMQAAAPQRVPFGRQEYKLSGYPTNPRCVPRWFNDTPGRIARALRAGYTHVLDAESGAKVTLIVGTAERGGGLNSYLMEIPKEYYRDDFAAKQANLDLTDNAIRRGKFKGEPGDSRYGDVKMRVTGAAKPRVPMSE